ncbi:unnamed protein product, partial [Didymodactylos carnosus]
MKLLLAFFAVLYVVQSLPAKQPSSAVKIPEPQKTLLNTSDLEEDSDEDEESVILVDVTSTTSTTRKPYNRWSSTRTNRLFVTSSRPTDQ